MGHKKVHKEKYVMIRLFSLCHPRYGSRPKLVGSLRLLSIKEGRKIPEEGSPRREMDSPNRLGDSYVQYWKEKRTLEVKSRGSSQNVIDAERDFSSDKRLTFSIEMISDLTKLLGRSSFIDRRLKELVNERLLVFAESSQSFENHQYTIDLLQALARKDFTAFYDRGVKKFINSALENTLHSQEQDQAVLELLLACAKLSYRTQLPGAVSEAMMKELVCKMSNEYLAKDFSSYCEYFYALAKVEVPWRILPIEKRKGLLSCLKRFGEVEDGEGERARGRLIYGVEKLLILKQSIDDTDEGVRQCYERLLMKELEGRYSGKGSREMRGEDERIPIASAILFQLRSLGKLRGKERLSERQLDLIYKGLEEEWQMTEMNSFDQALVILGLGEMSVNYRSLPKDLWSMMMDDLRDKLQNRIKPVSLSSLCKGWKSMGYKWKDMDERLKEAVLRAVVGLCRDERNVRGIANVILYLGDMEADWEKDMKDKQKDILEGIALASLKFDAQGLSNTLLGLSYMKASWKGMSREVQNSFLIAVEAKCKEMNEQNSSNTLYSLGQLGLRWKDIPQSLKEKLLDHLYRLLPYEMFILIDLNASLNGLNTLRYYWKKDEKLYESIFRKIEGYYGNTAKISKISEESFPRLVYNLGEGKVQWKELRSESKQALMNGMEVYCKGGDVDAKKVSNMIYGLGNMGATIYNIPALMKELLEGAVRKIARKNDNHQHIANIMYSFSQMQYSWEMIGEDTRQELLHMIRQSSREFNAQDLCNTCYSVAVMIRDNRGEWEKSYFLPLQECLLRRYYEIRKKNKGEGEEEAFHEDEALSQLSVYLSWLETLPPSSLSSLLQSLKQDKLPDIVDTERTEVSLTHKRFSDSLRELWRDMIEKEVREGKMSEEKKERMMKVKIVDEYIGLSRKVFPIDIAVVEDVVGLGGEKEEKVWLFIEIDGDYHKHTMKFKRMKDGSVKSSGLILETADQLKKYLYDEKYKGVPIKRYDIKRIINQNESVVNEIVKELWKKVSIS